MDTSGSTHEGWMTAVPLTVFVLVVIVALGGPTAFVNTVSLWVVDLVSTLVGWLKGL